VHGARRQIVRIIDDWPTSEVLLDAYRRIELISLTAPQPVSGHRRRETCPDVSSGPFATPSNAANARCRRRRRMATIGRRNDHTAVEVLNRIISIEA
jgi:hypothetical protein